MSAVQTRPESPQPPGIPRWVAMFYEPSSASWRVGAESPYRFPVVYAVGEMTQTLRARGDDPAVTLWGPKGGGWERHDSSTAAPQPTAVTSAVTSTDMSAGTSAEASAETSAVSAGTPGGEPSVLRERMTGRRQQVLMAGLGKAGLYDLGPDDLAAVRTVVDGLDETTVRRVAHWLTVAGGGR
ncbi:hypothetical protein [Streptomyces sp. DSM 40750]|uniref:hypothetical protein n=1 Tax=Streptomyces sp. DSM 40750 TaxID=2801030 RepID=UPI00214AC44E|nr:hypothetical protein [Streptomyces sp. DSM 40750]UUU23955.1 hypothetical protein JIX55_28895 [Streptomyces sp. DSM 40750]